MTDIRVTKKDTKVDITVIRSEGADGSISCTVKTDMLTTNKEQAAIEFEDFGPFLEIITFGHGETEVTKTIDIYHDKKNKDDEIEDKLIETDKAGGDDESDDEIPEVMFMIKLEKPEPAGVKISKKNVCYVTIVRNDEDEQEEDDQRKLLEYYLNQ